MSTTPTIEALLSSTDVCQLVGCTYRELDYWIRVGTIRPVRQAVGTGTQRGFSMDEVREVALARQLRRLGAPLDTIRLAIDNVNLLDSDDSVPAIWSQAVVVTTDGEVLHQDSMIGVLAFPRCGWFVDLTELPSA